MTDHSAPDEALQRLFAETDAQDLALEENALQAFKRAVLGEEGPAAPVTLGRYLLERRLGRGGAGVVYLAFDPQLDRHVAIKLVDPRDRTDAEQDRLLDEARTLAQLSHPNIVAVHDAGRIETTSSVARAGSVFLVMERLEGATLDRWVREHDRTDTALFEVALAAGRGIAAAHDAGIVHGDVKPTNVMVCDDGTTKVLDFGLARSHADDHTRGGGTPLYAAPECLLGDPASTASDQYAFAVTLWACARGEPPFSGGSRMVDEKRHGPPRLPEPSPRWMFAVRRALSPDPDDRYPSMEALLVALRHSEKAPRRWPWIAGATFGVAALVAGSGLSSDCSQAPGVWTSVEAQQVASVAAAFDAAAEGERVRLDVEWSVAPPLQCERQDPCGPARRRQQRAVIATFASANGDTWRATDRLLALLPGPEDCATTLTEDEARALTSAAHGGLPLAELRAHGEEASPAASVLWSALACLHDDATDDECLDYAERARKAGQDAALAHAWVQLALRESATASSRELLLQLAAPLLPQAAPSVRARAAALRAIQESEE